MRPAATIRLTAVLGTVLAAPVAAEACATCFGAAQGPMIDGARMGVWALFLLTLAVQIAFAAFFITLYRRSRSSARREAVKASLKIVKR